MTILLDLMLGHCLLQLFTWFTSDRVQQFQAQLLLLGWMLISGTEYLDLYQVARDFYQAGLCPLSAGSSYRTERPMSQFPKSILRMKSQQGVVRGTTDLIRQDSNHLRELSYNRRSWSESGTTSYYQPEEFGKGERRRQSVWFWQGSSGWWCKMRS